MLAAHVLLSFSSHFAIPIRSFVMLSHGFLLDCGFVQVALPAARECHSRQADLCSISSDVPVTVEKGERHRFVCRRAGATMVLSETRGLSLYRVVRGGIRSLVRLKA